MSTSKPFDYIRHGTQLANKNIDLYLFSIGVIIVLQLFTVLPSSYEPVGSFVGLTLVLVNWSYNLSIPVFLQLKEKEHTIVFTSIVKTTLRNTKRIIFPGILLLILLMILVWLVYTVTHSQYADDIITPAVQQIRGFTVTGMLFLLIFSVVFSYFAFTPVFFSLKKYGLISSMVQSVIFAVQHWRYMTNIILINVLFSFLFKLLPLENVAGRTAIYICSQYIQFIITASSLIYYQSIDRNKTGQSYT